MTNTKTYFQGIKFFFEDFKKPFNKLLTTLKLKWTRGIRVAKLKTELTKDLESIRVSILNGDPISKNMEMVKSNFDKLGKVIDMKTLEEIKILSFLKKIETIDRGTFGYEEAIEKMFESFYSKLDRRLYRLVTKLETKAFVHSIEYDEESSLSKNDYMRQKIELQIELVKLQEWAVANKKKIAILFEGRDAAGKGSSIKRFVEYINPKYYRVVSLGIPTKEESDNWFPRYEKHLPKEGEIVFFDRSWYNRGVVEPTMGYCTDDQYKEFMNNVTDWEKNIIEEDVILIKFWFSVDQEKQLERFELRKQSPLKHWKYSPNDEKTISKWGVMTKYKEQMFERTSTTKSPWVIINSNDKRLSRLNSIRYVLSKIDYTGKDEDKDILPSPEIVKVLK